MSQPAVWSWVVTDAGGPGHSRGVGHQHRDLAGAMVVVVVVGTAGLVVVVTAERAPVPDVEVVGWMTPRTSTVVTTKTTNTMAAFTTVPPDAAAPGGRVGPCRSVGGLGHYVPACQPGGSRSKGFRSRTTLTTAEAGPILSGRGGSAVEWRRHRVGPGTGRCGAVGSADDL